MVVSYIYNGNGVLDRLKGNDGRGTIIEESLHLRADRNDREDPIAVEGTYSTCGACIGPTGLVGRICVVVA